MSEIAVRPDHTTALDLHDGNDAVAQLARWAQAADAAYQMARKLVTTSFVPQQYRGKPEEATAAILAGAELGFGPMAALRTFDNIQGTPAPKAITLRAVVQAAGHEIRVIESTPARAVVAGRRRGDDDWQSSTWDIERAQAMGLTGKDQWKKQPAAMLIARATSEVARWIASDAIMGMPYSAEELRDDDLATDSGRPRAMRVTTADILAPTSPAGPVPPTVAAIDDAVAAGASAPWEPGEREQMIADHEAEPDQVDALLADSTRLIDERQKRRIFAELGKRGITDRADRLARTSKVIGRAVASMNDLTADEAEQVITSLTASPLPAAEPTEDDQPF